LLVTRDMVEKMAPGSVIVDVAAERGGNCELTQASQVVVEHDVTIIGYINLASTVPYHASQMYARNVVAFLLHLTKEHKIEINTDDEITRETLVTHRGEVVNPRVREFFSLPVKPA
jgi:NAD(P) transhydrogenase subunit alpha